MSSNSSKPRPIHQLHRELRSTPDEAEPSYSYEQESFMAQREDEHEDAFHRNYPLNRRDSTGSHNSSSNDNSRQRGDINKNTSSNNSLNNFDGGTRNSASTAIPAAAGANGSFWRMEALQQNAANVPAMKSVAMSPTQQAAVRSQNTKGNNKKTAGGGGVGGVGTSLLGAALSASALAVTNPPSEALVRTGW
jgi:hypothetical protein